MIGNEEDFTACLGFEVEGNDENLSHLDVDSYATMIDKVVEEFPNISVVATTLRQVRTASRNDWSAIAWSKDTGLVRSVERPNLEILDRVGGGDSFAAGLVAGLMETGDLQKAVELGAAHGALAMTTPGDTSGHPLRCGIVGSRRICTSETLIRSVAGRRATRRPFRL